MRFGLEEHIIDTLIEVFESNPKVHKAFMFGSRAKGNYRVDSDIDIAIKGQHLNTDDIISLSVSFETKGITKKVDLLDYNSIKEPELKEHIDRVGIEFYSRWKEYMFSELLVDGSISYGIVQPGVHTEKDSVPIIRVNNIKNGHIITDDIMKVSSSIEEKYLRTRLEGGELLITVVGSIGECAIVPVWLKGWNVARAVSVARIKEGFNVKFIQYAFKTDNVVFQLYGNTNDTVQPTLNLSLLKGLKFSLPPLSEQAAIASILSSLDDKIDLLHRQNKTLEKLAEVLFMAYFSTNTDEKKLVELGNYVECVNGVSYKSSELNPSKVGMISLKNFDRNGGFGIGGYKEFTGKYKKNQIVNEGDLIVAHTDITQNAEIIGNPALVIANPNFDTMIISMDIVKVISKVDWISNEFLYFLMRTREFKSHCEGYANGSTVLHLNKLAIPSFELPLPEKDKIYLFTSHAKEFINKIFLNHRQVRLLVKTRDSLIPKLMSGEVRVTL